ncbi:MAG TPA: hypothetical protein VKV77_02155 [Methylovirgula sp.]|nr:hypothetical protein [Methylovirgula sp.]
MVRLLNVLAIVGLVGSAIYAYSIKYETIFRGEKIVQLRQQIRAEQDAIAMLKAEWEHVSRPERIEALSDQFLAVQEPTLKQVMPPEALPAKPAALPPDTTAIGSLADKPALPPADTSATPRNPHAAGQSPDAN